MNRRVLLQRFARRDLDESYRRAARSAPEAAARWLGRFEHALSTLSHNPERCPFARENGQVNVEVREFLFGRRPHVFRVIFTLDDDAVRVLRILRAQRRFLTRRQLEDAIDGGE